tara:strand:+ start:201 stop:632 length:432 start_codon:yes stop_codon:yes gene_type:complete
MLGLNTSYLKYIILGVLLYGLVLVVNNKLLNNNDGQSDGFTTEQKDDLNDVVEKLTTVSEKLNNLVEKIENMNTVTKDKDDEDDEDYDEDVEEDVEKPKEKFRKKRETFKKKKVDKDDKHEGFTNYTTGVSSAFGGDYLLLDH